ncbi:Alpha-ketoglutaric semialdehyde dehydrogenase 2 [Flavobacterium bizetiae]|uniref:Alpha-ketoglutaric semialdehyde dehydrogenase 2 n=1 Tax=Flavobacterium bizetiae TaxID=2704140 RepID=A0A6J4GB72_9FLAO|nr:aldehyde dehydrogenase (NADP(+)) [Flavobacterium bizetiae]CAA9196461.1 Alpha-ketoglutaric semialdehyde dehydrogenase 2 [Flavobacterium bizetiae]CAD5340262.1 Alpha-ketoglutaric semialdehyde dehydrogenase 2 [Flavobacterium bizetiae]CAD5346464.1 Alpha-ketoglutaric semialdehyde dehydrogenase 2 [Flavobacterium bizetiae]
MTTGKNYIGDVLSAKGKTTYKTINPELNSENETVFYEATDEEISQAVALAEEAFKTYGTIADDKKADFLEAIADEIETLAEELLTTYIQESGLPAGRANGERGRTTGQLRAFATMLREGSWVEAIINKTEGKPDIRRLQIPIGPVVVFGASNFPLAFSTAGGDTASALAAGCPVVVKSHPLHAGTGELVASAVIKAAKRTGMPNGVFSNLNSSGIAVGTALVEHPSVKAVGFTGSIKGGTALCKIAANRAIPIPVYAEMGSINPVLILPSALKTESEKWAKNYAASIVAGTGQFCTNPGLILGIKSAELDNFIAILALETDKLDPTCMLHPTIKKQYENLKSEVLDQEGYTQETSLEKVVKPNYALQNIIAVDGATFLKNKTFHKEVFGPFSVVVKCDDVQQLNTIILELEGQLTGTVLNADLQEWNNFREVIENLKNKVGRLIFNNVPTGVEVCSGMTHGGPFPASSDSKFTSVGLTAVKRWVRPVTFQDWPDQLLPDALQDKNPLNITRTVNDILTKNPI